jgi:2-amino-4-hydroxy-6-hydroxymethyldihydropteridine diphosphokinase
MSRAVLSIGANLGDRLAALQGAVDSLRPWVQAISPVYETPPWGPVPQPHYLNAVLLVADDEPGAAQWLARGRVAETAAGRVRDVRWGPRSLDVDVVDVAGQVSDDPELTLPHPRAGERAFVLVPWLAADPAATLAGRPVSDWLALLAPAEIATVVRFPQGLT